METITNAASSVGTTVSNLIYGAPAKDNEATTTTTAENETGGKEPISGEQGKGTVTEPFDKGNSENPVASDSTSGNTSSRQDDFLKLSPAVNEPTPVDSAADTKTGDVGESKMPITELTPDAATSGGPSTTTTSSATGITDKAGVTDKVWKPTALDEVKTEGAPGAGPSAPEYTPATPDMSQSASAPNKASDEKTSEIKTSDSIGREAPSDASHASPGPQSVGGDIDAILESVPKSKHNVDDNLANDPHSQMANKTVRQTEASKHGESENSKGLASEKTGTNPESSSSPSGGDDKGDKKMSHLKEKLKNKLHIGSKDK